MNFHDFFPIPEEPIDNLPGNALNPGDQRPRIDPVAKVHRTGNNVRDGKLEWDMPDHAMFQLLKKKE